MIQNTFKSMFIALAMAGVVTMTGCASINTAIEKRDLDVQSKMSDTVFLEPLAQDMKTVFIDIRSTADKDVDIIAIRNNMTNTLKTKGYTIVTNPNKANIMLQGNVLSIAKVVGSDPYGALSNGFGGAVVGGTIGLASGSRGSYGNSMAVGSLIGGAIGLAAGAMVKDVYYNGTADIQIKQKLMNGQKAQVTQKASSTSGMSSNTSQTITGTSDWVTFRTRVVSVANQVNLEFAEAKPIIENQLAKTVGGIF